MRELGLSCPPPPRPLLALFFFSCCGFVLLCCCCFVFIFVFSNIFFIFLILFHFLFFVIVLLFVCCLFFFATPRGLQGLGSQAGGWAWAAVVEVPSPNHWTNREPQTPGNINQCELSQRSSYQHQNPAPPNCLQTPVLDTSSQTTSKRGTQPHPSKKMRWKKNMVQRSKVKTYKTK